MKEKLMKILAELGFKIDEIKDWGIHFDYDEIEMFCPDSSDEEFLSIIVPGILKRKDDPELFDSVVTQLNADAKYVKAYENEGLIWLCYERECIMGDFSAAVVERMILQLSHAYYYIETLIQRYNSDATDDDDNTPKDQEK